jgi:hypothetical protein
MRLWVVGRKFLKIIWQTGTSTPFVENAMHFLGRMGEMKFQRNLVSFVFAM